MRLARRLRALERDLVACVEAGQSPVVLREGDGRGSFCITVRLEALGASHRATLSAAEYELLCQLPRAAQVLGVPALRPSSAPTPK